MKLDDFLNTSDMTASELARRVGVSDVCISQWRNEIRQVPIERAVLIERHTDGAVTRQELRPDDWRDIWPELGCKCVSTQ